MLVLLLAILLIAIVVAAACNVVSALLGLGLLPEFAGSWVFADVKDYVADSLLWLVLAAGATVAIAILRDRRKGRQVSRRSWRSLPSDPAVVVALTAYNEALAIGDAVRDFADQPHVRQVLVVDNNSSDGTTLVATRAGAAVVHEPRQGYGYACMRGLREALRSQPDVVVLAEGDGTFKGQDVAKLLLYLKEADLVLGNRVTPGLVDRNSQMDSFFVWGNQVGAKLIQLKFWEWRFLGRTRLSDLGCTLRAIRSEALVTLVDDLHVGGDHFSPHMIMEALRHDLSVVEVPVTFRARVGVSKGASQSLRKGVTVGLSMLWHIVRYPTGRALPVEAPTTREQHEVAFKEEM